MQDHGPSLMASLLYCGLALVTSLWCWFQWKYWRLLRSAAKLPTVYPALPIIGHLYIFIFGVERSTVYLFGLIKKASVKRIKASAFWCGPLPYIMILDVADIKVILNSSATLEKVTHNPFLIPGMDSEVGPFTTCIFDAPVDRWRVTRRHFNKLFLPRNLQQLIPSFNKSSKEFVSSLSDYVDRGSLDIFPHLMIATLKSISCFLFHPEFVLYNSTLDYKGLAKFTHMYTETIFEYNTYPWMKVEFVRRFLLGQKIDEINRAWKNFIEASIKAMIDAKKQKSDTATDSNDLNLEEQLTILDVFRSLQNNHPYFTEADLRAEILIFSMAGFDTVGHVLSFCFMALAQHEDVQERLYNEILSVVGLHKDVGHEDFGKLQYLEQVMMEVMRRFTLAPFIMREATEDIKLGSYNIPTGSTLCVCLGLVHMNPDLYPDPEIFDPERFSPENMRGRDRFYYLPFSGGPRDCIGKVYAMQLMKVMMVHVLRMYRIRLVRDVYKLRLKFAFMVTSCEGFHVSLEQRV